MALALPAYGLPARGIACALSSRNHLYAPAPISRELFDSLRARGVRARVYITHVSWTSQFTEECMFHTVPGPHFNISTHSCCKCYLDPLRCII